MTASSATKPSASPDESEPSLAFWAGTAAVMVLLLNGLFQLFAPADYRGQARLPFLIFTVVVAAAFVAAAARPRQVGHALAAALGLASLGAGVSSLSSSSVPPLLALVLITIGGSAVWMTYRSASARSRMSWAFLAALLGVLAVCTLFGAPKIRNLMGVTMWTALLLPGLCAVATVALGMLGGDYRDPLTPRR